MLGDDGNRCPAHGSPSDEAILVIEEAVFRHYLPVSSFSLLRSLILPTPLATSVSVEVQKQNKANEMVRPGNIRRDAMGSGMAEGQADT